MINILLIIYHILTILMLMSNKIFILNLIQFDQFHIVYFIILICIYYLLIIQTILYVYLSYILLVFIIMLSLFKLTLQACLHCNTHESYTIIRTIIRIPLSFQCKIYYKLVLVINHSSNPMEHTILKLTCINFSLLFFKFSTTMIFILIKLTIINNLMKFI